MVRKVYRKHMLAQICTLNEESFGPAFGMQTVGTTGRWPSDYYHYRDNGGSVLAVAHLDTVVSRNRRRVSFHNTKRGPLIISGALDDRLGAYVILGLLPRLGVKADWLLTVGEEDGMSTAEHFEPSKQYDHIIEFDRMGKDVVMYQYEDTQSCEAVERAGARVGWGSFSDIAYLEHLGTKAFNWGVGYEGNYHSEHGYAHLNDTFAMVAKYVRFYEQNLGVHMPHVKAPKQSCSYGTLTYGSALSKCPICGARKSVDYATGICDECGYCIDCYAHSTDCQCFTPTAGARLSDADARAEAEAEDIDDAIAGARAAWWAGADIALAAASGRISQEDARRRLGLGDSDEEVPAS